MKLEYQRNPTEQTQAQLETRLQTLRRVEKQLNTMTKDDAQVSVSLWNWAHMPSILVTIFQIKLG